MSNRARAEAKDRLRKAGEFLTQHWRPHICNAAKYPTYWDGPILPFKSALFWIMNGWWPTENVKEDGHAISAKMQKAPCGNGLDQDFLQTWLGFTQDEADAFLDPEPEPAPWEQGLHERLLQEDACLAESGGEAFDIRSRHHSLSESIFYAHFCIAASEVFDPNQDNAKIFREVWNQVILCAWIANHRVQQRENSDLSSEACKTQARLEAIEKLTEEEGGR